MQILEDSNGISGNNQTTTSPGGRPSIGHMSSHMFRAYEKASSAHAAICGIQTHFKGNRTLKQMLVKPKDKDPKEKTNGVIYCYQCVEMSRTLELLLLLILFCISLQF